jgi:hypothetical protein
MAGTPLIHRTGSMTKRSKTKHPKCSFLCDEENIFVVFDGVKIARRGYPDTPQARTWVSLEPGFKVYDRDENQLVIVKSGVNVQ